MKRDAEDLAKAIAEKLGGPENIRSVGHCMTRLRLELEDGEAPDIPGLKAVEGVLGVVPGQPFQVVLGPGIVGQAAEKLTALCQEGPSGGSGPPKTEPAPSPQKEKAPTGIKAVLGSIANIFVPMIPAFVGCGLIGGIGAIITNNVTAGVLNGLGWQQMALGMTIIQKGLYAYLQIFTGINAAREWGGSEALGGTVGGVVYLTGMDVSKVKLNNFLTGAPLVAGQGGIIGVIFAVWVLCWLEKKLHRVTPQSLDIIVVPTLTLLAVSLGTIFLVMPLAGWLSNGMVGGILFLIDSGGIVTGFVMGTAFLPMVMFGLHQILTPIHVELINETGKTVLLPILAMAGGGQVGSALALWVRCRQNAALCRRIKASLPVGLLGIGEPLIYTVSLPLGRPFITACLGGGIGGAVLGAFGHTGATAIGTSGLALIPLIADGRWWVYLLGLLSAYAGGFVLTLFFGVPAEAMEPSE